MEKMLEPLLQIIPGLDPNLDLSKFTYKDRENLLNDLYKSLDLELTEKEAQQLKEERKRKSFIGRLRHFFKRLKNKKELEKEEQRQKGKEAAIKALRNPHVWVTEDDQKAEDGLYYYTRKTSVAEKTGEEIDLIQEKLRELGIGTQLVTDNDSNSRILLVSDPISNKNMSVRLFQQNQFDRDHIDEGYLPLTEEEYAEVLVENEESEDFKEEIREENEMLITAAGLMKDPQKRKRLVAYLNELSDDNMRIIHATQEEAEYKNKILTRAAELMQDPQKREHLKNYLTELSNGTQQNTHTTPNALGYEIANSDVQTTTTIDTTQQLLRKQKGSDSNG